MKYDYLKTYILKILKEDFGFKRHNDNDGNSLNQTSDNGNIDYDKKLYKYYEIKDYSDYNKNRKAETFYTTFDLKKEFYKNISSDDRHITIKTFNDIDHHNLKRKNLIFKLYAKLKI